MIAADRHLHEGAAVHPGRGDEQELTGEARPGVLCSGGAVFLLMVATSAARIACKKLNASAYGKRRPLAPTTAGRRP